MLGNVLHTARSALTAAQFGIGVTANNLANVQTDGFKSSRAVFTTQPSQTAGVGSAPSSTSGGSNPTQVGMGVQVSAVSSDFSQGSLVHSENPLDLALEGPGLFILEGRNGEQRYSRDGHFQLNANQQLVTANGHRVVGTNVDANYQLDSSNQQPLRIPVGAASNGAALRRIQVSGDGTIRGSYSDGVTRDLGRISVAQFTNPGALSHSGENLYAASPNSGTPTTADAGSTSVTSGATELSNTDIGREIVNLTKYETMFRANLEVLETADEMLDELLNLRRS